MDIVVDFDGTVTTHDFPAIGKDIGAVPVLKELVSHGHRIILFTMRSDRKETGGVKDGTIQDVSGPFLSDAVNWFIENEIPLYGIQENPTQRSWTTSPKAYGQLIIDDAALGCPLLYDKRISHRPFVNWKAVRQHLIKQKLIKKISNRSVYHIMDLVKSHFGITELTKERSKEMYRAKWAAVYLLRTETDLSLSSIASLLGFETSEGAGKCFVRSLEEQQTNSVLVKDIASIELLLR